MKKWVAILILVVILIAVFFMLRQPVVSEQGLSEELPSEVVSALDRAIDDEYRAQATYDAVLEKFGDVRPFTNIRDAEEKHINFLIELYQNYNLEVPLSRWDGNIVIPDTVELACDEGVQAEIVNAALYRDELLPVVVDYPDITRVFENLMNASQNNHLPAFERCN